MRPACLLLLLLLLAAVAASPVLGKPIVPRDILRYGSLDRPVWGDPYESDTELRDNSISSDDWRKQAVQLDAATERELEGVLEKPLRWLLNERLVAQLEALGDPRLEALLREPARFLAAHPRDLKAALRRPAYRALGAGASTLLGALPANVQTALRRLLRLPLGQLLRPDPSLQPLLQSRTFINTPDIPVTCPPGQSVASDGSCRDTW